MSGIADSDTQLITDPIPAWRLNRIQLIEKDGQVTARLIPLNTQFDTYGVEATALCGTTGGHVAPQQDCTCGFHVFTDKADALRYRKLEPDVVLTECEIWGRTVIHGLAAIDALPEAIEGYRAQHLRVLSVTFNAKRKGSGQLVVDADGFVRSTPVASTSTKPMAVSELQGLLGTEVRTARLRAPETTAWRKALAAWEKADDAKSPARLATARQLAGDFLRQLHAGEPLAASQYAAFDAVITKQTMLNITVDHKVKSGLVSDLHELSRAVAVGITPQALTQQQASPLVRLCAVLNAANACEPEGPFAPELIRVFDGLPEGWLLIAMMGDAQTQQRCYNLLKAARGHLLKKR